MFRCGRSYLRCSIYYIVCTTDLGGCRLLYRQDWHDDRSSAQLWRSLSYIRGGITKIGYFASWEDSSLSKTFILFVKIVRLCAAHKRMKITHDKKIWITSFFSAPMRFQVQSFNSLKNFSLNCQNCLPRIKLTHDKKNQDHIFFLCAYAFSSSKIHLSQKIFFSKP